MKSPRIVVIACLIGLAFSPGALYFQTFGLFVKPMAAEFGWGRMQLSAAVSIAALAAALAFPVVGRAIDLYGPRRVILASTVAFAVAIASLWFIPDSMPGYMAMAALVGVAAAGCGPVAYASVLARWFDARLGTSLAFAVTGLGLGQFLSPLYTNWLMQQFGWRMTYVTLGVIAFVITVPNALVLLRDRPSSVASPARNIQTDQDGISYRDALRMPVFWRLAGMFLLITVATAGCMVHIVPLLTDRGVGLANASSAAALLGVAGLAGRLLVGALLDRFDASPLGFVSFAGCTIGVGLILSGLSGLPLQIGVILIGASLGGEGDLMPFVVRRVFGMRHYGTIYGSLFVSFTLGLVLGPLLMALSFDRSGSYSFGLQIAVLLCAIATLLWLPGLRTLNSRPPIDKHKAHTAL